MDIEILDWTSDLDRPSAIDALDTADLPVCHTVSVTERRIAIDDRTIIQNNVRTDTLLLNLDGEWDGANVVVLIGKTGSEVELEWRGEPVVIPAQVAESVGAIDVSVVGYSSDGTVRLVTAEAAGAMTVIRSGALTGEVPAEEAPDVLAQLLESATQARDAASTATSAAQTASDSAASADAAAKAAQDATSAANAATAKATEAASAANEAANTANAIIAQLPLPDGNVPRATRRGEVVSVDDAFAATPLGLKVYGKTRQNLWVNPSGTRNGVTVTANADGLIAVSGTSTGTVSINRKSYILRPGSTYTLSVNKVVQSSNAPSNGCFFLEVHDADSCLLTKYVGYGTATEVTFTVPSEASFYLFGFHCVSGTTVSGTYRVMLNEGSTAEPWCPPGLTSAEPTQVVVAGKNLIDIVNQVGTIVYGYEDDGTIKSVSTDGRAWGYQNSNTFIILPPGTYTVSVQSTGASSESNNFNIYDSENNKLVSFGSWRVNSGNRELTTLSVDRQTCIGIMWKLIGSGTMRIQLELGSTATAYEPPNIQTLTLDPVELRGLPDGTADVLDVGSGSVAGDVAAFSEFSTPISGVSAGVADGYYRINFNCGVKPGSTAICDKLPYSYSLTDPYNHFFISATQPYICFIVSGTSQEEALETLASISPTVYAELATPTTSTVTPVALPTLPSPVCNVWAVSDVPCEVEMEYVRDVNVVLAKLEGAM